MKKFSFKYSPLAWVLLVAVVALSFLGIVWNVFNLKEYWWAGPVKIATYFIIIAITLALLVVGVSVMVYGCYTIKGDTLSCNFGVVKTTYDIKDVVSIAHFKKSDKLVVYFKDAKYTVIVIDSKLYDEFIAALRQVNPSIAYESRIDGEDTPAS